MRSFYYRSFIVSKLGATRRGVYNDDGAGGGAGGGGGGGSGNDGAGGGGGGGEEKPTLTQKQFNDAIAKEKRAWADKNKTTVAQLEEYKKTEGLTKERIAELEGQIGELEKTYMSQAEIQKRESDKITNEYKTQLEKAQAGEKFWLGNFQKHLVTSAITTAAATNDAFSPTQMLTQLGGWAKVAPVLQDGKETGEFEVKIQFPDKTKEGQAVVLDLTPDAAMKRMKELPETYGNLFKSGVSGGVGGNNSGAGGNGGTTNDLNAATADPETYRKNRKNLLK